MKLEDQLKNTFDHFETEVDPSVWAKVSARISAPVSITDGGSSASSGIAKTILAKIVPYAGWIAGASAIVGLGIILKMNSKEVAPVSKSDSTEKNIVTTVPVQQENISEHISQQTATENNAVKTISVNKEIKKSSSVPSAAKEQTFIDGHFSNGASAESNTSENNSEKNTLSTHAENIYANPVNKTTEEINSASKNINAPVPAIKSVQTFAEPVLIVNTRGGFAPLTITALSNQGGIKADFNFGDGTEINNVTSASHRYEESGIYTVKCTVAGRDLETTVEVLGQLPTAFSPNGDGVNDQFVLGGAEVSSIDVHIYDRSGKIMLAGKGKQVIWDGTVSGGPLAETGTYFYDIFATSVSGVTYKQKGTINLFR